MSNNLFTVNVYQIGQQPPTPLQNVTKMGFPGTGVLVTDITDSPNRSLSTGVNVYTKLTLIQSNLISQQQQVYYCQETLAQMVILINT